MSSGRSCAIPSTNSAPRKTLDAFPCFLGLQQHPRDRTLHGHGWKTSETSHLLKYLRERTSYRKIGMGGVNLIQDGTEAKKSPAQASGQANRTSVPRDRTQERVSRNEPILHVWTNPPLPGEADDRVGIFLAWSQPFPFAISPPRRATPG
ncbi:hypothetical protein PERCYII10_3779 [Pseudomonas aeruginosa]|nr:hypothetical protein PERCYII10_3779 [Pseudomonas aeruginosa]